MKLYAWFLLLVAVIGHDGMEDMEEMNQVAKIPNEFDPTSPTNPEALQSSVPTLKPVAHVMKHKHGTPILQTDLLPEERLYWENYNTTNYLNHPDGNKTSMILYLVSFTLGLTITNPLLMAINNLDNRSLTYLVGLIINSGILGFGLFNYSVFMASIPDLYPNNVLNKFNWIYLFTIIGQVLFAVIKIGHLRRENYRKLDDFDDVGTLDSPSITLYDLSRNQSPDSFELDSSHRSHPIAGIDSELDHSHDEEQFTSDLNAHLNILKTKNVQIFDNSLISKCIDKFGKSAIVIFNLLNWFNFLFIFVYIPTGIATFGLFGKGNTIYSLLAHFIKGGIFLFYGIAALVRYCGAFENKGWAWNHRFITNNNSHSWWNRVQPSGLITMEFIESSLIFFYGITNVFMEHLGNPGGEWTAKDLEHASIAFIYIGSGAAGLLVERFLNDWRFNYSRNLDDKSIVKSSPGFSPNPFPLVTIFWTGFLMSKHQQASALSTEIHNQWGNLFLYGTLFRFLTYVMMLLLPKQSNTDLTAPSQPMTEIIVSFCLIAGGAIFMESCDPVVLALEYRGVSSMFSLNVALGLSFLMMAWIMVVFQFKSWYKAKYY